jgi:tetratricopeptide (TPR) repeat protein
MKKILHHIILISLVCLAYGNTLHHSFHFDDIPSILEKPWIRGLDKIPDFIFSYSQRPLVILSFNINYAISEFKEWSYHVFNITFHLLVVFLIYRLGKLIISHMSEGTTSLVKIPNQIPILAASIFAVHPLNTQAVTYISSRSSIMAAIFYLVAIILFFEGLDKKQDEEIKTNYIFVAGAVISFGIGLLCKLIVVSLPAILFAYHYYFISDQNIKTWVKRQWKLILGVGGLLVLVLFYKKIYGDGFLRASIVDVTTWDYFRTQIGVIPIEYFRKMIFPFNLTLDPGFQVIQHWRSPIVISGIVILGVFSVALIKLSQIKKQSKKYAPEAFGLMWILITLSPTSSFIPLLDVEVEHRTYLPLVGFSICLSSLLIRLKSFIQQSIEVRTSGIYRNKKMLSMPVVLILLILISFLVGTRERNKVWTDEVSLWADAKQKAPFFVRPYNNLGEAYDKIGSYDLAIEEFEAALRLSPNYFFALSNLGNIYGKKKEYDQAISYTKQALRQKPDYAPGHYNLAKALHMTGNPDKAMSSYRLAIKYNPYFEEAFFNLGFLAMERKQFKEAIDNFKSFLKMQPSHPKAHFGLATSYAMMGKQEEAKQHYENAIAYDSEFLSPYINLANLHMVIGNTMEAKNLLKMVLLKNPSLAGVHKNLGLIFMQEKDMNNASEHFKEYLRLMPTAPDALAIKSFLQNKKQSQKQS